jgi:hypothetical protein
MAKIIGEGITFDDVLLQPAYSEVIGNQIDISTRLTNKIRTEHSAHECRHGHGYRIQDGHCHGTSGRNRNHT